MATSTRPEMGSITIRIRRSPFGIAARRTGRDPSGERALGEAYRLGIGVTADPESAATWLQRAADQDDAEAEYRLAMVLDGQQAGYPHDRLQSWLYLLRAAGHGHDLAAALVGTGYMTGAHGPGQDQEKAGYWLSEAVERAAAVIPGVAPDPRSDLAQELTLARFELGLLLLDGDGVPADAGRAVTLITDASDHGLVQAADQLGWMYHTGRGVPHDDEKAVELLRRAAGQGSGSAAARLGAGYLDGWAGIKDEQDALRWFRVGAALSDPDAWIGLARMYELGVSVARDGPEAAVWYALAANAGRTDAQKRMADSARLGQLGQQRDPRRRRAGIGWPPIRIRSPLIVWEPWRKPVRAWMPIPPRR